MGAETQTSEESTELTRAGGDVRSSSGRRDIERTLDHPLHLRFTRIEYPPRPAVLPREELDELDRADHLVEHAHALVARGREPLLDADGALHDQVVEGRGESQDNEPCEGGPA